MRSTFIAIVLCVFAAAAAAQCVVLPTAATVAAKPIGEVAQGGELIRSAVAGTHDEAAAVRVQAHPARGGENGDNDSRTGPALLFAALALMSGIALRRYNTPK